MTLDELRGCWRSRAEQLRPYSEAAAVAFETAARELEAILPSVEATEYSITQAAALTGYTADHIGRLLREQRVDNVGEKHRPRLRQKDVEQLAAKRRARGRILPAEDAEGYDPRADARSLMRRRAGGSDAA